MTATDRFLKLGRLCCKKYISYDNVKTFDYTSQFCYPDVDEIDWGAVKSKYGGLIQQVDVGRKRY